MVVDREKLLRTLRDRLHEAFMSRYQGAAYARIARATGYADGYMQAMLDAGLAAEREMLGLVGEERQRALRTEHPLQPSEHDIVAA
ncbi:MAG: hypothetical protein HY905_28380 [Deltaproteobacteria bacterium]|nr:hypothetical protein [Deltaproteobacteria bacterium]